MGLTTAEFIKMVESGKLLAEDFMPGFAKQIRMMVRENGALAAAQQKLTAQQQRLTTSFKILIDKVFQGGGAKGIGALFKRLAQFIEFVTPAISGLATSLFDVMHIMVETTAAVGKLITSVIELAGLGGAVSKGWQGVKSFFHLLTGAIWQAIAGIHTLEELVSGDRSLGDFFSGIGTSLREDWQQNYAPLLGGGGNGGGTTIQVNEMNVNANNADDLINEMTAFQAF